MANKFNKILFKNTISRLAVNPFKRECQAPGFRRSVLSDEPSLGPLLSTVSLASDYKTIVAFYAFNALCNLLSHVILYKLKECFQ